MIVKTFCAGGYASNTYLLISGDSAAIIDPSIGYDELMRLLLGNMPKINYIILTHAHFDHILKIDEWKEQTGAEVLVGEKECSALSDPYVNCYRIFLRKSAGYFGEYKTLSDNEIINLGTESIKVVFTPGHTAGGIALYADNSLFVGDTVFAYGAIGRTDLPGSDYKKLSESIKKIQSFPDDTKIFPGHGEPTYVSLIKKLRI